MRRGISYGAIKSAVRQSVNYALNRPRYYRRPRRRRRLNRYGRRRRGSKLWWILGAIAAIIVGIFFWPKIKSIFGK